MAIPRHILHFLTELHRQIKTSAKFAFHVEDSALAQFLFGHWLMHELNSSHLGLSGLTINTWNEANGSSSPAAKSLAIVKDALTGLISSD